MYCIAKKSGERKNLSNRFNQSPIFLIPIESIEVSLKFVPIKG
nr:MAG TPA_asm: hypothetical protein [Caudoviricetes sp.]